MSHLPGLSDYVGNRKKVRVSSQHSFGSAAADNRSDVKGELSEISDEEQIKNLFSGMSRSLIRSTARVARNKKVWYTRLNRRDGKYCGRMVSQ